MAISEEDIAQYRKQYTQNGFVIIPNLIPPSLFPSLQTAADRIVEKARKGEWSQVRIVGKQFPPWDFKDDDIWGVQNIMHPDLKEGVFLEWYGSGDMLRVSAGLMGCEVGDMQFELFNLLINPLHKDYKLSWHRDDIKATATPSEETEALKIKHYGIQWNAALYDDDCLSAVPGSHCRVRTEAEREANLGGGEMPGAEVVRLRKGETVFYNNNILHVGKYNLQVKRRTLHGCYGCPPEGDTTRARNILQHDLAYTRDPAFRASLPEQLKPMVDRLNGMQSGVNGKPLEYSQDL